MSRPRRAAALKNKIEELDLSEESDDGDFSSGDSDEYDPTQTKTKESDSEQEEDEDEVDDDEEESDASPVKSSREPGPSNSKSSGRRAVVSTLRGKPKNTLLKFNGRELNNKSLKKILENSQYKKRKSIFDETQNGNEDKSDENVPDFDCAGGLNLSDASDEGDDFDDVGSAPPRKVTHQLENAQPNSINEKPDKVVDLKSIHDNYQQYEQAKEKMKNYKKASIIEGSQKENLDIGELLAMGEKSEKTGGMKSSQKRVHKDDSDSDEAWEDVEGEDDPRKSQDKSKNTVEVFVNSDDQNRKKEVKEVDIEAQMKRKFNRRRKEIQVQLHKANLVAWIAHSNYVNRKLNDVDLMASALSMLPKNQKQCYPAGKTDIEYFKQITAWYRSTMTLKNKEMYCQFKTRPKLLTSLALQIKLKVAICRRDYVLIYVALLRAIGIECRVVQSLICAPMAPPKNELMSLSKKTEQKAAKSSSSRKQKASQKSSNNKKSSKKSSHSKTSSSRKSSSSSKSKSQPKIPQLDGVDDRPKRPKRILKIKGPAKEDEVEESYVDIPKETRSSRSKSAKPQTFSKASSVKTKMNVAEKMKIDSPKSQTRLTTDKKSENQAGTSSKSKSAIPSKKLTQVQNNLDVLVSPRRLRSRSKSKEVERATSIPKNAGKSSSEKPQLKSLTNRKRQTPQTSESVANKKLKEDDQKKNELKVFSPRRLRSRSKSQEPPVKLPQKPNLKCLSKKETLSKPAEKRKLEEIANSKEIPKKKPKIVDQKLDEEAEDSDSSAKLFKIKKSSNSMKSSTVTFNKKIDRRVLSSDDNDEADKADSSFTSPIKSSKGIDIWVELYSEKDERWIPIDIFRNKIDKVKEIAKTATHPLVYTFAWNNDKSIKDVSARYCPNLNTTAVRKMRVDSKYLASILMMYPVPRTAKEFKENDELNILQYNQELPKAIKEYKNHPLYALRRDLLKYEAIYPPEPAILGYIRDEAIYPRDCVHVLHTRETWLKEARTVKLNEEPYKITKTMKWEKATMKIIKDVPQDLFGLWQTQEYEPPVAENGLVPRNAYGNVELFKPQMLPIGCVHLQLPGLIKVCKKLNVDYAQAVIGFDSNGGWPFPVYDGVVVCQEFEEKVLDAWNREQEQSEKRELEKYEKRVYGNWKKLIKGLWIRQRLKIKYNFEGDS